MVSPMRTPQKERKVVQIHSGKVPTLVFSGSVVKPICPPLKKLPSRARVTSVPPVNRGRSNPGTRPSSLTSLRNQKFHPNHQLEANIALPPTMTIRRHHQLQLYPCCRASMARAKPTSRGRMMVVYLAVTDRPSARPTTPYNHSFSDCLMTRTSSQK